MRILRHLSGYAPVKLAATLASFGGIYLFTRLLGPDEYGRYALMFSAMALIHLVSLTWVEAASYRFGGAIKNSEDLSNHFRSSIILLGFSMVSAAFWVGVLSYFTWDYPEYRAFLPYIALLLPLNTLIKIAMEAHKAQQNVRRYMFSATSKILLGFIFGVGLAWKTGLGAVAPIAGLLCGALILAVFEGRWVIRHAMTGRTDRAALMSWAIYGIPTSFALGLDLLLSSTDRFLIAYFIDEAAVGSYAAGYGIADKSVLIVFSWIAMALSPLLMEAYEKGDRIALEARSKSFAVLLILTGLPIASGLAIVASPLADAMIGASLREQSKLIIPWIAFSGLLNGFAAFYFTESFHLAKRTRRKAVLMVFPLLLNIGLNIILIPLFGLMGAVTATILSYVLAVLLLAVWGRKHVVLPIPLKELALAIIACAAMTPVGLISLQLGPWADLFAMAGLGALIYTLFVLIFNLGGARDLLRTVLNR